MKNERIIIDFKSNESSGYIKSIQEELQKRFDNDDAGVSIEVNEGNPVPSLDEILKKFDKQHDNGIPDLWEYDSRSSVENFIKFANKILQNGVETDNVQPKHVIPANCPNFVRGKHACTLGPKCSNCGNIF